MFIYDILCTSLHCFLGMFIHGQFIQGIFLVVFCILFMVSSVFFIHGILFMLFHGIICMATSCLFTYIFHGILFMSFLFHVCFLWYLMFVLFVREYGPCLALTLTHPMSSNSD